MVTQDFTWSARNGNLLVKIDSQERNLGHCVELDLTETTFLVASFLRKPTCKKVVHPFLQSSSPPAAFLIKTQISSHQIPQTFTLLWFSKQLLVLLFIIQLRPDSYQISNFKLHGRNFDSPSLIFT